MADYGVATPSWEPLPWSWAAERLMANRNFWVVTVSAGGRPHAMPVWGVWDEAETSFAFSEPERAFAVIEREEESSTRATRWVFESGG